MIIHDDLATRLALAEARLAEIRRYLADHPEAQGSLEEEELGLESFIAACKISVLVHEFVLTLERLKMAEKAHDN